MDTSKFWFKPSISRDRGEAASTGQPRTQSSPEELGCHPTVTRGGTPSALGGAGCGESQDGSGGLRTPLRAPKIWSKLPGPPVSFWHCRRASAGRMEQGTRIKERGSHSAPLSSFWCFDSNPAAEGQGARHVRCEGQHVVPGLLRAGHEGSRLSIRHPDRYRGSLGKAGLATGVESK